jgi:hypothetical protein
VEVLPAARLHCAATAAGVPTATPPQRSKGAQRPPTQHRRGHPRQFGSLESFLPVMHETPLVPPVCRFAIDCTPSGAVELGWPEQRPRPPVRATVSLQTSRPFKRQARVPKESARRAETGIRCAFGELFCYPGVSGTRLVRHVAQDWIRCGLSANRRRSSARRVRYTLASSIVDSRPRVNSNDTTHVCRSRSVHMLDGNRATAVHPQLSRTISCVLSKLG